MTQEKLNRLWPGIVNELAKRYPKIAFRICYSYPVLREDGSVAICYRRIFAIDNVGGAGYIDPMDTYMAEWNRIRGRGLSPDASVCSIEGLLIEVESEPMDCGFECEKTTVHILDDDVCAGALTVGIDRLEGPPPCRPEFIPIPEQDRRPLLRGLPLFGGAAHE